MQEKSLSAFGFQLTKTVNKLKWLLGCRFTVNTQAVRKKNSSIQAVAHVLIEAVIGHLKQAVFSS